MKVSLNWLKRYIDLPESPDEIAKSLTLLGFEVDDIETTGLEQLEHVVVGEILDRQQHPDADRLGVCQVALGDEIGEKSIVCGATNYKVGDRVPVALPGAKLPGGFKIKRSKLRGVESDGMMCSGKELGVSDDHQGLLILDERPELGTPINDVLTDSDTVFTLEVTPNRPDCLSHIGIARELAAWYKRDLAYPSIDDLPAIADRPAVGDTFNSVAIDCEEQCPQYMATVIKGVKIGPSPDWMKSLLTSIGLRPINNVVDVTNFVMHECGNPMHAFDARDIANGNIRVRLSEAGEKLTTLDDVERELEEGMVVISDDERGLAVAGVMGGQNSEVKEDTSDVVLEVAYFNPSTIRWVSKKLALSSDSSYRFERGIDPKSLEFATNRAVQLIVETAGGEVCAPHFEAGSASELEYEVTISPDWIRAKSGFEITNDEIRESLLSLELSVTEVEAVKWTIGIPSYRGDLDRDVDILEEVLRLYGTHRIPSGQVHSTAVTRNDHPIVEFTRSASNYLFGQHFNEAVTYTLRSEGEHNGWDSGSAIEKLSLANPISEDQVILRSGMIAGLLEVLHLNQSRKTGATRFFEAGRTFQEINGKVSELITVGFIDCNGGIPRSWKDRPSDDFFHAKKRVEAIAKMAGIDLSRFAIEPVKDENSPWQAGHSATVAEPRAGIFAEIGLVNLKRTKEMDIEGEVVAGSFSILTERLKEGKRVRFKPFSLYPPSAKDLALIVDADELAGNVAKTVEKIAVKAANGFECESVEVFDIYEGEGVGEGKKSVAVSMSFRSLERTLKDKEVNKAFEAIQNQIKEKTNYEIRD